MSRHETALATCAMVNHWPAEVCVQLADLLKKENEFECDVATFKYNHFLLGCGLIKEGDRWVRV